MATHQKNPISLAIEQALQFIPCFWPLQQFVATNPLADLISQPINQATEAMQQLCPVSSTLTLEEYWVYFENGRITESAIKLAISEFSKKHYNSTAVDDTFELTLLNFLTSSEELRKITQIEKTKTIEILFSLQIKSLGYDSAFDFVQSECLNWLSTYFNPTSFQKILLCKLQDKRSEHSFFDLFKQAMFSKNYHWNTLLSNYPESPQAFITQCLSELAVPNTHFKEYILQLLWQIKGWVGFIKWQQQHPNNPQFLKTLQPEEIVAVWLALEVYWKKTHTKELGDFSVCYKLPNVNTQPNQFNQIWQNYLNKNQNQINLPFNFQDLHWIWQHAFELEYQSSLEKSLLKQHRKNSNNKVTAKAQWVFCIDVRSEGLRRHIERQNHYETFGFAGFFGFVFQLYQGNQQYVTNQCPALLEPSILVELQQYSQSLCKVTSKSISKSIQSNRKALLASFVTYDSFGFWFALTLLLKNYSLPLLESLKRLCRIGSQKSHAPNFTIQLSKEDARNVDSLAQGGVNFLKSIGLTTQFSEFVIICGHSATTTNNPYQAGLDCGACGGNSGMSNAIVAAQILNRAEIRDKVALLGIDIPKNTVFIAACHDTCLDKVMWYEDPQLLSQSQKKSLQEIKKHAFVAGQSCQQERIKLLPGDKNVFRRAKHWAELIPEWGLANNAAMVIGPRTLTESLDLSRRVFLHSYDANIDPNGTLLANIFSGPVVVAHMINSQYYFSATDPLNYSSGNKAVHNLLPNIGVMEGNQSDLKYGLPEQSVFFQTQRLHEPQRLWVYIDAEDTIIQKLISENETVNALVKGHWITVKSLR